MMNWLIATVLCGGPGPKFPDPMPVLAIDNRANLLTPCQAYQQVYEQNRDADIILMAHDDIEIFDLDWLPKVLNLFIQNPNCVAVGLGGATSLGREGLYKRPYRISDMSRGDYASNQRDWNVHGSHLHGARRVAVLDAFFMAVRSDFLGACGGWPVDHLSHHGLDLWLACEAARAGKEIWATGIDCHHYGGGTSTKPAYRDAKWLKGRSLVADHEEPHKWLHETYRDVLPIVVSQ